MVYEVNAIVIFADETNRDTLATFVDNTKSAKRIPGDMVPSKDCQLTAATLKAIEPVGETKELDSKELEPLEADPVKLDTYTVSFSLRYKNDTDRKAVKDKIAELKSTSIAGVVYEHLCGHDEGKSCRASVLVDKWIKESLTAEQKDYIKEKMGD